MEPTSKTDIIERFINSDCGIESIIARVEGGYSVVLRDLDADKMVGHGIIYSELQPAITFAKHLVYQE